MPVTAWLKVINNQLRDTAAELKEAQLAQTAVFVLKSAIMTAHNFLTSTTITCAPVASHVLARDRISPHI
jgi:hypothetical protein